MESSLFFRPKVIAHRGASFYAPENTMAAFVKAAQLGAKWVEFDVMLSADNKVIVFHDETLDRTTNATGDVGEFTLAYLRTLDAGSWFDPRFSGERIPTFTEVLDFLESANMQANVELKPLPGQDKITSECVFEEIVRHHPKCLNTLLFSSFSLKALEVMRNLSKNCPMGLLMHEWLPDWQTICEKLNCITVDVNQEIITPDKAKEIKNTQRQLLCYTVNDLNRAKELYSYGVDAVFSDIPDKMIPINL